MNLTMGRLAALFVLAVTTSGWAAAPAADDQSAQVGQMSRFLNLGTPKLYSGSDALGNCRLFVYTQGDADDMQVWAEGTFQSASGPAAGVPIVFMMSSAQRVSRVESFEISDSVLSAVAVYPPENDNDSEVRMGISVFKGADGALTSVNYETSSGKRSCSELQRIL